MKCNNCKINFNEDDGYNYIVEELKKTRDNIDNIIRQIESRQEKDALINEVLNTDYSDEKDSTVDAFINEVLNTDYSDTSRKNIINNISIPPAAGIRKRMFYPFYNFYWSWY